MQLQLAGENAVLILLKGTGQHLLPADSDRERWHEVFSSFQGQ